MMDDWSLISSYTRAQALADGVLVDCSALAQTLGYIIPVAITDTFMADLPTDTDLCHVLVNFMAKIRQSPSSASLLSIPGLYGSDAFLHIGPGDSDEPVLTLMRSVDL